MKVKINVIVHLENVRGLRLNQFRLQSRVDRTGLDWTGLDWTVS